MNTRLNVVCLLAACLCGSAQAQAQLDTSTRIHGLETDQWVAQNTRPPNTAPSNNTIRRINPNSRQGTVPNTPPAPGPTTAPPVRRPSLENGEIGNGYPRNPTPPETVQPTAPSLQRDKR